jgi:quercetin dioxygenase-like cupin family protein
MDIPRIEGQIRRDAGSRAEVTAWGCVDWIVRADDPPGAEQTLAVATWSPGLGNAEHTHPNCEEIVYVLEGAIDHTLGEQVTTLKAGDVIVVPRDVPHRLVNNGATPVRTLIVFSSPDRQFVPTG